MLSKAGQMPCRLVAYARGVLVQPLCHPETVACARLTTRTYKVRGRAGNLGDCWCRQWDKPQGI